MVGLQFRGLPTHKVDVQRLREEQNGHEVSRSEVTKNIVNRLLRQKGLGERVGSDGILDQLEITAIPRGAVIHIANTMTKAAMLDGERIRVHKPLVYVWLETYLMGMKGTTDFVMIIKELGLEQVTAKVEETSGTVEEGE